jgi:FkbM family methyltransferase
MRDRRLQVLDQYSLLERGPLVLTVACQRLGFSIQQFLRRRLAAYVESKAVFDDVTHRGRSVEKRGAENWVEWADEATDALRIGLRRGSSDFATFLQVFQEKQYQPVVHVARAVLPEGAVRTVVDAGANIGLATLYFQRQFPDARIIAIEAEPENYAFCRKNLAANGLAATTVLNRGLWRDGTPLAVGAWQDRREWAYTVRPAEGDAEGREDSVMGVTVEALMADYGLESIDILKIDIEGAEHQVFEDAESTRSWLPKVKLAALEIHTPAARELIARRFDDNGFFSFDRGELTIAVNERAVETRRLLDYFRNN